VSHLDEGTLVAVRDGALVDADANEHLSDCAACRAALTEAEARAEEITAALATLDALDAPVEAATAKEAVRARLGHVRDGRPRRTWAGQVGRAAAVLLLAAGAAYATPGSPVRGWLTPDPGVVGAQAPAAVGAQELRHEGAIEVNVPDGRIHVVLQGVQPGEAVEVVWTEAAVARIVAAAGSSFSFGEGRAEATVAPGPVRVELPRYAPDVAVEVDGRVYLRRTSGSLEVLEPVQERSDAGVRFVVTGR